MSTKRMSAVLTVLSLFLCMSLAAPDVQAATYSFTTFDVPGATSTHPTSINASGQVTGFYYDSLGQHGFVYSGGTFTTFDVPGAISTRAASINAGGQVTGYYFDNSTSHGFLYSNGTFMILDVPGTEGSGGTEPTSINDSGQVTGNYHANLSFVYSGGTFMPLIPPGAVYTNATSINASGQVTGNYCDGSLGGCHGFVYSGGTFTTFDVPGAVSILPASINASGQVTGNYCNVADRWGSNSDCHGFVYSGGMSTDLTVPGAYETRAGSINNNGQVTGSYSGSGGSHGFVYSGGTFTTLDVPGATDTWATSINASGQMAGGSHWAGVHGFIATPVCVTPTVTTHTLTTAPHGGFRITGSITLDSTPLCALVLANGQFMFTCGDPLPKGDFDLTVPLDDQGQITLFGFSSGLSPFQQTLGAGYWPASATGCAAPTVTHTLTTAPDGGLRITGSITLDGAPLCALVLANGQFMFTCGDALPQGDFDLTVPLDDQGKITLFGFSAGLLPFQQTFSPSAPTPP